MMPDSYKKIYKQGKKYTLKNAFFAMAIFSMATAYTAKVFFLPRRISLHQNPY